MQRADYSWHDYGSREAKQGAKVIRSSNSTGEDDEKKQSKIDRLFPKESKQIRKKRSYKNERKKQILRWISTLTLKRFGGVEIQSYWDGENIVISSNQNKVNQKISEAVKEGFFLDDLASKMKLDERQERHRGHLFKGDNTLKDGYPGQEKIRDALKTNKIVVPSPRKEVLDLHAERRIQEYTQEQLNPDQLGGVKRPCAACAAALNLINARPGPIWTSTSGLGGSNEGEIKLFCEKHGLVTYITLDKETNEKTFDYDTDSDDEKDAELKGKKKKRARSDDEEKLGSVKKK